MTPSAKLGWGAGVAAVALGGALLCFQALPLAPAAIPPHPQAASHSRSPQAHPTSSLKRALAIHRTLRNLDLALNRYTLDRNAGLEAQTELLSELRQLTKGEPPAEIARSLTPEELDTPFGKQVLTDWLDSDPVAATRWIASNPNATDDQAWLVAQRIMDQPRLAACIQGSPEHSAWRQALLGYAAQQAMAQGPDLAASLAAEMDAGPAQNAILQQTAASWILAEPDAAIGWIETLEAGPKRDAAALAAVAAIAPRDPQIAAQLLDAVPLGRGHEE